MDTSYGPNFLDTGHGREAVHSTQPKNLGIYRANVFFHRPARFDGIACQDRRHDAAVRSQRQSAALGSLKTFVSAGGNDFHYGSADLHQRSIVGRFGKRGMKSSI